MHDSMRYIIRVLSLKYSWVDDSLLFSFYSTTTKSKSPGFLVFLTIDSIKDLWILINLY